MKKTIRSLFILFSAMLMTAGVFAQQPPPPQPGQPPVQPVYPPPPPPRPVTSGGADKELSILGGYSAGDRFGVDYGEARVDESGWLEATLSIPIKEIVNFELTYQFQSTSLSTSTTLVDDPHVPIDLHYFLIGAVKTIRTPYPVVPFFGLKFGGVLVAPGSDSDYNDRFLFAVQLGGGIKYFMSEHVGIKLELQLNMPMQGAGASIGCGTGGCGYGVSTFTTITQFGGGGGLVFAF